MPCWMAGIHTNGQCLPDEPAGVVSVTASSMGATLARESASMRIALTCAKNSGRSRLAAEPDA